MSSSSHEKPVNQFLLSLSFSLSFPFSPSHPHALSELIVSINFPVCRQEHGCGSEPVNVALEFAPSREL